MYLRAVLGRQSRAFVLLLPLVAGSCKRSTPGSDAGTEPLGPPASASASLPVTSPFPLTESSEYLRVHYPAGFTAKVEPTSIKLSRATPDEGIRLDISTKQETLEVWTKLVIANAAAWRTKYKYVETLQRPGKCLGEDAVHLLGTFEADGVKHAKFECTFLRDGRAFWFSYDLPVSEQLHDEAMLRQILEATEILPSAPPVPNADRVIAGLRPQFKQCYQRALNENPDVEGRTVIVAKVSPNGNVTSAVGAETTGLPDTMVQCIANVVLKTTFEPPGGAGATLEIPVKYVAANKK